VEKYSRKCRREVPRRLSSNCRRFGTHCRFHLHRHLPMKMEPAVSSETSAIRTPTPGNYPKRNKLLLEHGESLKKNTCFLVKSYVIALWHHHEKALQLKACFALNFFLSFSVWPILPKHFKCRGLLLHLIALSDKTHTNTHTFSLFFLLGRTPLEARRAPCRILYLRKKQYSHERNSHAPAGFETAVPTSERIQNFSTLFSFHRFSIVFCCQELVQEAAGPKDSCLHHSDICKIAFQFPLIFKD